MTLRELLSRHRVTHEQGSMIAPEVIADPPWLVDMLADADLAAVVRALADLLASEKVPPDGNAAERQSAVARETERDAGARDSS